MKKRSKGASSRARRAEPRAARTEPVAVRAELHPEIPGLARELVSDALGEGRTTASTIALVENTCELTRLITQRAAAGEQVACRPGCAYCCTLTVIAAS